MALVEVRAEMVANVLVVDVVAGDSINVGDQLLLLESMKMEIPVFAEVSGTIEHVGVSVGEVIQEGDLLIRIESK